MTHISDTQMSTSQEVLRRHRNLTEDIRTRVTKPMREDLQTIAERRGWSLSDANREAIAEFIGTHKSSRKTAK